MRSHRAQRNSNTVKVLDVLRHSARCTINEIADRASLSRLTVAKILDRLETEEIVRPDGKAPGGAEGGPKPQLFHFNPSSRYSTGILVGPETIFGRLVDMNIDTVARVERPLSPSASAAELVACIDEVQTSLLREAGLPREVVLGVGVGCHGVTDSEQGVVLTSPHNPGWGDNLPLRDLVQKRVGRSTRVYVDNAIRFRTLAETTAGMLRNVESAHVIYCADGLIGGNILGSAIYGGAHSYAGSIGHMKVNVEDTEQCACGGYGCFEMQVSEARVLARTAALRDRYPQSSLYAASASRLARAAIFAAAEQGDPLARAVEDEVIGWFAIAIHNIILMLDPEVVVIQGRYGRAGSYFLDGVRKQVGKVSLVNVKLETRIEASALGDEESGTLGAASFVLLHAFE